MVDQEMINRMGHTMHGLILQVLVRTLIEGCLETLRGLGHIEEMGPFNLSCVYIC